MIRRCLEPNPADRYALAAELAADLQAVAAQRPSVLRVNLSRAGRCGGCGGTGA